MNLPLAQSPGAKRPCSRCRVSRHDRCVGPEDCGCQDRSHFELGLMAFDTEMTQGDQDPTDAVLTHLAGIDQALDILMAADPAQAGVLADYLAAVAATWPRRVAMWAGGFGGTGGTGGAAGPQDPQTGPDTPETTPDEQVGQ